MGELAEKLWAVMSERGREASGLAYAEAAQLVARLKDEKISGLSVITAAAAERLTRASGNNGRPAHAETEPKRKASRRQSKDA
ncbi:MAG TPA: hypothetical protein VGV59_02955 [Pyrinomonadaceae bacterium]|nr:hypothetical protein [Pyrinomonadaceae bacterium]